MNDKAHLKWSITKSIIRIAGCIGAIQYNSVLILGFAFMVAEFLGIGEEIVDER